MQFSLIQNPNESQIDIYKTARVIYAETYMPTLPAVEALASMIRNIMNKSNCGVTDVINDTNVFSVQNPESGRHKYLSVDANDRAFQMCVRVVRRMMHDSLPDKCFGATRFHRVDEMPDWAVARGYIADVDGLLFYNMGE